MSEHGGSAGGATGGSLRVLAIGAGGFIGGPVVGRLIAAGHDVAVLHRAKTVRTLPEGARAILGDRNRLEECRAEIERFAADVVVDMIPYTERQARTLVETFHGRARRIVAAGSADVYRNYDGLRGKSTTPPDPVPLAEDAPLRDVRYPYRGEDVPFEYAHDYDKILVEEVLLNQADLPATVLRLPAVYGPGDRQHRLRPYVRRMMDRRPAILLDEAQARWRWSRAFVENVAEAFVLAATDRRSTSHVYNVGEEPTLPEAKWVERIGAAAGWDGEVIDVPASALPESLRQPLDWRYDIRTDTGRLRAELGYAEPIPLDTALRHTVEWERSQLDEARPPDYGPEDAVLESI